MSFISKIKAAMKKQSRNKKQSNRSRTSGKGSRAAKKYDRRTEQNRGRNLSKSGTKSSPQNSTKSKGGTKGSSKNITKSNADGIRTVGKKQAAVTERQKSAVKNNADRIQSAGKSPSGVSGIKDGIQKQFDGGSAGKNGTKDVYADLLEKTFKQSPLNKENIQKLNKYNTVQNPTHENYLSGRSKVSQAAKASYGLPQDDEATARSVLSDEYKLIKSKNPKMSDEDIYGYLKKFSQANDYGEAFSDAVNKETAKIDYAENMARIDENNKKATYDPSRVHLRKEAEAAAQRKESEQEAAEKSKAQAEADMEAAFAKYSGKGSDRKSIIESLYALSEANGRDDYYREYLAEEYSMTDDQAAIKKAGETYVKKSDAKAAALVEWNRRVQSAGSAEDAYYKLYNDLNGAEASVYVDALKDAALSDERLNDVKSSLKNAYLYGEQTFSGGAKGGGSDQYKKMQDFYRLLDNLEYGTVSTSKGKKALQQLQSTGLSTVGGYMNVLEAPFRDNKNYWTYDPTTERYNRYENGQMKYYVVPGSKAYDAAAAEYAKEQDTVGYSLSEQGAALGETAKSGVGKLGEIALDVEGGIVQQVFNIPLYALGGGGTAVKASAGILRKAASKLGASAVLSSANFGLSSAGMELYNAEKNGANRSQAILAALGTGTAEGVFSLLPVSAVAGVIKNGGRNTVEKFVKGCAKTMLAEGTEEGVTELTQTAISELTYADDFKGMSAGEVVWECAKQAGYAAFVGGLTGIAMGGGAAAAGDSSGGKSAVERVIFQKARLEEGSWSTMNDVLGSYTEKNQKDISEADAAHYLINIENDRLKNLGISENSTPAEKLAGILNRRNESDLSGRAQENVVNMLSQRISSTENRADKKRLSSLLRTVRQENFSADVLTGADFSPSDKKAASDKQAEISTVILNGVKYNVYNETADARKTAEGILQGDFATVGALQKVYADEGLRNEVIAGLREKGIDTGESRVEFVNAVSEYMLGIAHSPSAADLSGDEVRDSAVGGAVSVNDLTSRQLAVYSRLSMLAGSKGGRIILRNDLKKGNPGFIRKFDDGTFEIILADTALLDNITAAHEFIHILEGTEEYAELLDFVKGYLEGKGVSVDRVLAEIAEEYAGFGTVLNAVDAEHEMLAMFAAKHMFDDEILLLRIAAEKPNLMRRLIEWVSDRISMLKAADADQRFYIDARAKLVKAWRAAGNGEWQSGRQNAFNGIDKKTGMRVYNTDFPADVPMKKRFKEFNDNVAAIFNAGGVELTADGKKIRVMGDKFTAKKTLYGQDDMPLGKTINALYDLVDILSTAKQVDSNPEESFVHADEEPKNAAHKDVQHWYTFRNNIIFDGVPVAAVFDIRDKGDKQYQYRIKIEPINDKKSLTDNSELQNEARANKSSQGLFNKANIPKNKRSVKHNAKENSIKEKTSMELALEKAGITATNNSIRKNAKKDTEKVVKKQEALYTDIDDIITRDMKNKSRWEKSARSMDAMKKKTAFSDFLAGKGEDEEQTGGADKVSDTKEKLEKAESAEEEVRKDAADTAKDSGSSPEEFEEKPKEKSRTESQDIVKKLKNSIPQIEEMSSVLSLTGQEFPKGEKKLTEQVAEFFGRFGNRIFRKQFGYVAIDMDGIKSDIAHGLGRAKAVTFAAVPDVIKNGKQIDYQKNWKGRGYDSYVFAAPIYMDNKKVYVAVVVTKKQDGKFYLHEVVDEDGNIIFIKKEPADIKTPLIANNGSTELSANSKQSIPQTGRKNKLRPVPPKYGFDEAAEKIREFNIRKIYNIADLMNIDSEAGKIIAAAVKDEIVIARHSIPESDRRLYFEQLLAERERLHGKVNEELKEKLYRNYSVYLDVMESFAQVQRFEEQEEASGETAEQAKQTEAEKILQRVADEQSEEVRERKAEDADSMTQRAVVIENELEANYRINIRLAEDFRDGKISKEEFNRRRREILEKNEELILEKNRLLDSVAETADAAYFKDKFLSQPNLSKMSEEEKSKFYLMKRDENEPDYITVARYNAQLVDEYYAEHINPLKERYNELKLTAKEEELVQGLLKDENSAAGLNAELFADVNFGKVYRAAEILKKIRKNSALIEKINLHIDYKTDAVFFVKELEGDSTKGPNSIGISKSIYRNFQTALRNASKECKEFFDREVFQKLAKAKKGFSDGFIRQAEDLRKNVIDLGIKAGSKESAAVQWYGEKQKPVIAGKKFYTKEYTLLDLKKEFGYKMANGKYAWENIVQAEKYFRKQYDAYVYKINDVLRPLFPNPYDKDGNIIPGRRLTPRKDYFHHFIELDDTFGDPAHVLVNTSTEIDPRLLGVSEYTNPKTKWTGFLQHRSDKAAYTADAVGGYLKYMQHAEYKINVEPLISEFTALYRAMQDGAVLSAKPAKKYGINPRNQEPKEYGFAAPGDSGDEYRDSANADVSKNQFLNLFNLFIKDLAGKSNPVDRGVIYNSMGDSKGRKFLNFTDKWVGKAKSAAILGNFGSMVVQIANAKNFGPYVKQKYLVKGLTDGLSMMMGGGKEAAELLHKSQFLQERFMHRSTWGFAGGFAKRAEELAGFCLEVGDKVVAEIGWLGAYHQAVAEGSADPVRRADDITRECVGGRGVGEIPLVMKSRLVSSVLPFQLEVLNNYNVRKDIWQKKGFASKFKGFLTLYVSTYVMNCMFEEILGRRVDFDPISILIELAQNWNDDDDDDDEEEKVNDPNNVEHPILSAVNAPLEKFGGFTDKFIDVFRMFSGEYLSNAPAVSFLLGCVADNENVNEFFGDVSPNRYGTGTIGFNVLIEEFVHLANGDEVDWKSCAAAFVKYGNQLKKFLYFFQDYSLLPDVRYNREEGRLYLNSHEADGSFKFGSNSTGRMGAGGKLSYALDKNPYNIIKDLLFGGTSTGSAIDPDAGFTENFKNLLIGGGEDMGGGRGWIKSGFKNGLYENETEAWKAMTGEGTKPEEAKANIDFIKSLPEHFMKVYALDMMDYSAETKGRIYKGIVTQYKSDGEFIDKLLNAGASYEGIYKYYKYVDTCEIMDMKVSYAYALGKTGIPLDKQAEIYFGDEHKCYDSEYDVMETLEGYGLSRKDYYSVLQAGYNVSVWPGDEKDRLDKYIPKALEAGVSSKDILLVMAAKSTFDGKFYENHGYNVKYANSRAVKLISDLKLSSKQKDALHRLYWADSSLRFAPWHGGKSGWSGDAGITAKEAGFGNNSYAAQAVIDAVNRKNRRSGVSPVITLPNGRKQTSFTNKFNVLFWEYLE